MNFPVPYDALGNRLTTYSGNATRLWVTDHADPRKRPLMEADANGVPVRYYVWGGGMLLAVVETDGTVRYCHSDEQGSVVALTDDGSTVTDQYCYGPYGADWGHSGTNSIPFRWLGSHGVFNVGGSSLHLTRYRAYDTYTGRFLSSDPLGLGGGPNLYAYCLGNPLAYIDPLGLGAEGGVWYDQWSDFLMSGYAFAQDAYNQAYPWWIAWAFNTAVEFGAGIANTPQAIGHLGEGAGSWSADMSWETSPGLFQDIATAAGVLAAGMSVLPSANVPLGVRPNVANAPFTPTEHWETLTQKAPQQGLPYEIRPTYNPDGTIKNYTTYDSFGGASGFSVGFFIERDRGRGLRGGRTRRS